MPYVNIRTCSAFDELPDENWAIAGRLPDEEQFETRQGTLYLACS